MFSGTHNDYLFPQHSWVTPTAVTWTAKSEIFTIWLQKNSPTLIYSVNVVYWINCLKMLNERCITSTNSTRFRYFCYSTQSFKQLDSAYIIYYIKDFIILFLILYLGFLCLFSWWILFCSFIFFCLALVTG